MPSPIEVTQEARRRFERDARAIRSDDSLSASGKSAKLADLWGSANRRIRETREAVEQERRDRVNAIDRQLFGAPNSASMTTSERLAAQTNYRQAVTQALAFGDQDAASTALRVAKHTGDEALVRAIGLAATERGWRGVLQAWSEDHPDAGELLGERQRLASPEAGDKFRMAMAFGPVSRPDDVDVSESWE